MRPRFQSILFEQSDFAAEPVGEPAFFSDLNLDQVREAMLTGREEYDLAGFFHAALHDPQSIDYRQEVVRDLEQSAVRGPVEQFAQAMRAIRELVAALKKSHYKFERQRLLIEAAEAYCGAVRSLTEQLGAARVRSRGFHALLDYLQEYVGSPGFGSLLGETRELLGALGEVRYSLQIKGARVRVGRYEGEGDFSAEIEETFAKFKQGQVKDYLAMLDDRPELNHVEAQVVERVARLHPDVFASLAAYFERHGRFADPTIARFDREVQFYLAYLDYIGPLRTAGLAFCYPELSNRSKEIYADQAFDLALAAKLAGEGQAVVWNSFALSDPERILVVTGPNQGGKTTFARMFGQLHHLGSLGLPVPGANARLFLADAVFTHFERDEELATLRGKLEDELIRLREILAQASAESILVMNESFSSTTLEDALFLGTELIGRITELDALAVYVTFVDELSSLNEATVSIVAGVAPDNPTHRTFELVRRPADGLAYAAAIADKYGLGYESLRRQVAR